MKNLILKKVNYLGSDFYKIIDIVNDLDKNVEYDDFNNILNSDKELFYYQINDDDNFEEFIGKIVTHNNDKVILLPNDLNDEIDDYVETEEEYQKIENPEMKNVIDIISRKYPFQKQTSMNLLKRLYKNQEVKNLDLSEKRKRKLLKTIIYLGTLGCDKDNIINEITNNINIPTATINISLKDSENVNNIMEALTKKTKDDSEASKGIVFIRVKENLDDVIKDYFNDNIYDNDDIVDLYLSLIKYLTNKEIVEKNGHRIDFRTLTFVIALDVSEKVKLNHDDILHLMNTSGAQVFIIGNEMSIYQKIASIMGENGPMMEYAKYFESFGKKLKYDPDAISYLVEYYHSRGYSIRVIENALENVMDYLISKGVSEPAISLNLIKEVISTMEDEDEDIEDKNVGNNDIPILKNIYEKVLKSVVGQDKQVKEILYNILLNRRMANMENLDNPKQYIKNILLRGESGGGKTFIISTIAKILNIPMFVADATSYTEAGYVGNDVTDMLVNLYHAANDDLEAAEKGILVIDEIDKKAGLGSNNDITRGAVLNSLLKIIEGSVIPINVGSNINPEEIMFDTSRLTVIASGAFEDIEKIRDKRVKKESTGNIGFTNNPEKKNIDANITDKDFVEFGMIKQFMARFPVIVNLTKNTKESLKNIMLNSDSSALKIEAFKLNALGIKVEFTDDFYDELADIALRMEIGARGIDKALHNILSNIHIEDIDYHNVDKIILNKECITDPNALVVISKTRSKVKSKKK